MKHEITLDLRRYFGGNANENRIRKLLADASAPIELTHTDLDQDNAETSLSADYTRPLGKGKLDVGARMAGRGNDYDNATAVYADEGRPTPTSSTHNVYQYDERFNSVYATANHPWKKFGFTGGLRFEAATTEFELPGTGEKFSTEYNTLFPSAALSYDFGGGTTARINYGKRVGRPWPDILNPYMPVTDPLNRRVGNPYLKPNYTHSVTAELSKVGTRGTLRFAPYYRATIDQWMDIKRVDSAGVSTVTWANVANVVTYGASVTASLRPGATGRLSGSTTLNVYHEERDAGALTSDYIRSANRWSANANAQFKVDEQTNVQTNFNYNPPRILLQGRMSAMIWSSVGVRRQFMDKKASVNLFVQDPLALTRFNFTTNDRTHEQLSRTRPRNRQASLSFTYNWGKPPQQQSRRQSADGQGGGAETTQIR